MPSPFVGKTSWQHLVFGLAGDNDDTYYGRNRFSQASPPPPPPPPFSKLVLAVLFCPPPSLRPWMMLERHPRRHLASWDTGRRCEHETEEDGPGESRPPSPPQPPSQPPPQTHACRVAEHQVLPHRFGQPSMYFFKPVLLCIRIFFL